jgi:uncharacterized protein (TIGR02452 family)
MGTMARKPAAELARRTMEIVGAGRYEVGGRTIWIQEDVERAVGETVEYPPGREIHWARGEERPTRVEATGESSLEAARRLVGEGARPCVLNFASAKNPGGGFLNGARAQEESLARSSALYACLSRRRMYDHHRMRSDPLYTSWVIYSPRVPVFFSDDGDLLDPPYLCSFLTSPACNAGVALERAGRARAAAVEAAIQEAMAERVERVLGTAAAHDERALVLGAWGCGVFRNDPEQIAERFKEALDGPFRGVFDRVIFAVLDSTREQRALGPFQQRFG